MAPVTFTATRRVKARDVYGVVDWHGGLIRVDVDLTGDVREGDTVTIVEYEIEFTGLVME